MISGLFLAWILALFGFDEICIQAMQEIFNITITSASYYFVFAIVGIVVS